MPCLTVKAKAHSRKHLVFLDMKYVMTDNGLESLVQIVVGLINTIKQQKHRLDKWCWKYNSYATNIM